MKPLRIAFAAKQRSGKDTAAEYILQKFPGQIIKFADPLYALMDYTQEFLGLEKEKDRRFLQLIGTDWGRAKNPNIWVDKLFSSLPKTKKSLLITDARFMNEFERCKEEGFILVKINTTAEVRMSRGSDSTFHPSEVDMDEYTKYDYEISNNGSLEDFHAQLDDLIRKINEK